MGYRDYLTWDVQRFLCLSQLAPSYWPVFSQFCKACPSVFITWRNSSLEENCCCISEVHGFVFCTPEFHFTLVLSGTQGHLSSLPFNTVEKYSSVLMMTPKITVSVNFIGIFPTSLLRELMTSIKATDNFFLLSIFPVYCDLTYTLLLLFLTF